jgi:hypothetical protein
LAPFSGGVGSRHRAARIAAFFARQIEAVEFADDGVAAQPEVVGNFAAGQPGFKAVLQEFDAFVSPGRCVGGHGNRRFL